MAVTLRWTPNSWFEIVGTDAVVQVDPSLVHVKAVDPDDQPAPADLVLVTHHHSDHCDPELVSRLAAPGVPVHAPARAAAELGSRATVVRPGDVFDAAGVHVEVVPAYNTADGSSTKKTHEADECVGYVITVDDLRIYHAGDTDLTPEMADLEDIDVALLPIGGEFTMNASEAAQAALLIDPGIAIPMHPRDADPWEFARLLEDSEIDVEVVTADEELDIEIEAAD